MFFSGLVALLCVATMLVCAGCNTDYSLGGDYSLDGQQMQTFNKELLDGVAEGATRGDASDALFSASLTTVGDQINGYGQTAGLFGLQKDSKFGTRRSGFFTQYTPGYALDSSGFGENAVAVDSVYINFVVESWGGDTTSTQRYAMYELLDDSFLRNSADSVFLMSSSAEIFKAQGVLSAEPLLEFNFPDLTNNVPAVASYSYMCFHVDDDNVTDTGRALFNKLALLDESSDIDYTIYGDDFTDFIGEFKGLYIVPVNSSPSGTGGTYGATLSSSAFGLKISNVETSLDDEGDIVYTDGEIVMSYIFRDELYLEDIGGSSIATVERGTDWVGDSVVEGVVVSEMLVEGMGGVVSELRMTSSLFAQLEEWIAEVEDQSGEAGHFDHIFINKARLRIYLSANQDMNLMPTRLGMYRHYSNLIDSDGVSEMEFVTDYDYSYEALYGSISSYGGLLNRSHACYEMYLERELQDMYGEYLEAKAAAGGDAANIDWSTVTWNRVYIAPIASSILEPRYARLECSTTTPIALNITYTVMKR